MVPFWSLKTYYEEFFFFFFVNCFFKQEYFLPVRITRRYGSSRFLRWGRTSWYIGKWIMACSLPIFCLICWLVLSFLLSRKLLLKPAVGREKTKIKLKSILELFLAFFYYYLNVHMSDIICQAFSLIFNNVFRNYCIISSEFLPSKVAKNIWTVVLASVSY